MNDYDNEINLNDDIINNTRYVWLLIGENWMKNGEEVYIVFDSKKKAVEYNKKQCDGKCTIEKWSVN